MLQRLARGFKRRSAPWVLLSLGLLQIPLWLILGAPEFPVLGLVLIAVALRIAWRAG